MSTMLSIGLLVLCALLPPTGGLYFHVGETEQRCFIEDVPEDTLVVGVYRAELFDRLQNRYVPTLAGLGMRVRVRDADRNTVMDRMYGAEGRFTFTSEQAGEHSICLHSNSSAWFGGSNLRVHLDLRVGEGTNDYSEIAARDKLTELQLRVRQLLEVSDQIRKEQDYQRTREERFRETSESTSAKVFVWALLQTLTLLLAGVTQVNHLKGFFRAKKIV